MPQYIEHRYGKNVHIVHNLYLNTLLTQLCQPETQQPFIQQHVEELFRELFVISSTGELKKEQVRVRTRMSQQHKKIHLESEVLKRKQAAVSVSLARAGIPASQVIYQQLNHILDPQFVRQDHIWAARITDKKEHVTGAALGAAKIGGDVKGATVFLPDPMGATGSTIIATLDLYKKMFKGKAAKFVALHLIITPEYVQKTLAAHPDLIIYALRIDRGLSSSKALKAIPGTYPKEERGLNEKQYIVPGAGGLGEILNNSFV